MDYEAVIDQLSRNRGVYQKLLEGLNSKEYTWKTAPEKWSLLEIVCHLYDEEKEDFRARAKHTLETPALPMPPIDPEGWVKAREYDKKDFSTTLNAFLKERSDSIEWLNSLENPNWNNVYQHPKFGEMSAKMFLSNWAAHDYLHLKQILKLKFDYLKLISGETMNYAGDWV